jgi:hypothetical protein
MGASYLSHRSYKSYPWQALPRDSRLQSLPRTQIEDEDEDEDDYEPLAVNRSAGVS